MPIPTERLLATARVMGERSRRHRTTRTDAELAIRAFAKAWAAANRDPIPVPDDIVEKAVRAFARARQARWSIPQRPTLPMRLPRAS